MSLKIAASPRGLVVDCPWRVSLDLAIWMRRTLCVEGFIRSMPHADGWYPDWLDVLSAEELLELTANGFGVTGYQIFRAPRQMTRAHGAACGRALVSHAESIGLPMGVTLFFDAEQFRPGSDTLGVIDEWRKQVARYTPSRGLYCGAGFKLPNMASTDDARTQGERLYMLKGINLYWLAMSQVYTPAVRGPCGAQVWEYVLRGSGPESWQIEPYSKKNPGHKGLKRFDINANRRDALGGRMVWAIQ